ncbi:NAD(P)/FAD-dependent oxidoreductase [Geopsychrobacter electrodiphilus]|uniref:NAD(P)/FAD-dependent oxidoreductase n=1 Tax=Geopsychrobacter electrodiphilus TaxID=225196 RepID=UPI000366D58F|nr:NAD(P)/FAD-dependent oxidoreductase [Geopsychrobacter electrodiphilus]
MRTYDVIIIGGGPAGIFAAGFAAQQGQNVLLIDKNRRCGAKVLITGKGRCNVTHAEEDPRRFVEAFGRNGKAFLTALYAFGVRDLVSFFEERGLPLREERGGRIFPAEGDAASVQKVLEGFLQETGVELLTSCRVEKFTFDNGEISSVLTPKGEFSATAYVVATGGLSYPETGCTGDGYTWAEQSGHHLIPPEPALVPLVLDVDWTAEVNNFNLKNVQVQVVQQGKVLAERFGEAFFTREGIGGPIILDLSAVVRDALKQGVVSLSLDLKPALDSETFDRRLQREFAENANRNFANSLDGLLPKALIPIFLRLSTIDPQKKCHSISREERLQLLGLFKNLELPVSGVGGYKKAIVTSGGVSLKDIDMRSMRSKKIANLYFAGEMIDLDGPTGGFNLQVCWSTGYLAGISAAKRE